MALAHAVGDKVEAAYRRGDLFLKRSQLAKAWAKFCATPSSGGTVVPTRAAARATSSRSRCTLRHAAAAVSPV